MNDKNKPIKLPDEYPLKMVDVDVIGMDPMFPIIMLGIVFFIFFILVLTFISGAA